MVRALITQGWPSPMLRSTPSTDHPSIRPLEDWWLKRLLGRPVDGQHQGPANQVEVSGTSEDEQPSATSPSLALCRSGKTKTPWNHCEANMVISTQLDRTRNDRWRSEHHGTFLSLVSPSTTVHPTIGVGFFLASLFSINRGGSSHQTDQATRFTFAQLRDNAEQSLYRAPSA